MSQSLKIKKNERIYMKFRVANFYQFSGTVALILKFSCNLWDQIWFYKSFIFSVLKIHGNKSFYKSTGNLYVEKESFIKTWKIL